MKRFATSIAALALCASIAPIASAATLLSEGFAYANGGLVAVSGGNWTTHSGTGTDVTVTTGRAVGNMANAPDDNRTFPAQPNTGSTYACLEVAIADPGGPPRLNYFAHFKDTGTTNFNARLYVAPLAGGGWTFAISNSSTSTTVGPTLWSASSLTYGQTYYLVVKYDAANATSTLWVNPVSEASTSVSHVGTGTGTAVSAFALRQSNSSPSVPAGYTLGTTNWTYSVDNLGVGTTFNDACFQVTPTQGTTWGKLKTLYR